MKSARQVDSLKAFLFWNGYPLNYMQCLQMLIQTCFLHLKSVSFSLFSDQSWTLYWLV